MANHNINTEGDIPCNCPACMIMNSDARQHIDELAKLHGLSESEKRIMLANELENL